jgi:MFS family permease
MAFERRMLLRSLACFAAPLAGLYAGSNALSPNLSAIALEFSVQRDRLGGLVSLATWLPASGSAVLFGFAADASGRRGVILAALIVLGDAALLVTAAVQSLATLLLLRGIYGFALGGVLPLAFSCLGDWVGPRWRPTVVSALTVSHAAGTLCGQVVSGLLGARRGWRAPFLLIGGIAMGVSFLPLLAGDGRRGAHEPAAEASDAAAEEGMPAASSQRKSVQPPPLDVEPSVHTLVLSWSHVRQLLLVPSNALVYAATFPTCVPMGVLGVFAVDYVSVDRGMGLRIASFALFLFGLGAFAAQRHRSVFQLLTLPSLSGSFVGGMSLIALSSALRRRAGGVALIGALLGSSLGLCIVPMVVIIQGHYSPGHPRLLFGAAFSAGLLCFAHIPGMRAVLLNVNPPRSRGSAVALYALLDLLGRGVGPYIVARLAESQGRRNAFITAVYVWAGPAGVLLLLGFTLARDERRMLEAQREHGMTAQDDEAKVELAPSEDVASAPPPPSHETG